MPTTNLTQPFVIKACSYSASANKTSTNSVPIDFDTKEFDDLNFVSGNGSSSWKFTVPAGSGGLYQVEAFIPESSGTSAIVLYKNGVAYKSAANMGGTGSVSGSPALLIRLAAGDFIDLRAPAGITALGGTLSAGNVATISIAWIGL